MLNILEFFIYNYVGDVRIINSIFLNSNVTIAKNNCSIVKVHLYSPIRLEKVSAFRELIHVKYKINSDQIVN